MRAIIFDFFGTLNDPRAEGERLDVLAATAAELGVPVADFTAAMAASFPERTTGVHGGTRSTLLAMALRCGYSPSATQLDRAVNIHLRQSARLHRPRDGVLELLDQLRGNGFRLGLISDCSSELYECWPQTPYATRISSPVFSWQHGIRKPDQRLYKAASQALGVPAKECFYVGDGSSREHQGAREAGMHPVLVTNARVPSAANHRVDADDFVPNDVIDDITELGRVLAAAWYAERAAGIGGTP